MMPDVTIFLPLALQSAEAFHKKFTAYNETEYSNLHTWSQARVTDGSY